MTFELESRYEKECGTGYFGAHCAKSCSKHCAGLGNTCDNVNGTCNKGCDPGYKGSLCTQVCGTGYFGAQCAKSCSEHCAGLDNTCDNVNGTCNMGLLCTQECDIGYFGEGCAKP
ncbi:hypothetical protein RRG08_028897 [Elysia crispata]|uniref:Uncharacterized protein n=1 Tax=Elysia crispata TaxID=231223 RepID=A0AAE1API1_9GAST|nr:hypothetical protein RRG08_028897 [Elysia crispata]